MPAAMKPGDVLADRFELTGPAPSGGSAWRARDRLRGEPCALSVLPDAGADARARFERDMALRAAIEHPAVPRHVAHGVTADGLRYVATEHLDGVELRVRLARTALEIDEALALAARIAEVLAEAHGRGLVHGAISPATIFLPGGDLAAAKLLDLGLGLGGADRSAQPLPFVQGAGLAPGGPVYLSPEQAQGDPDIDARSDVFSLGCVLYECLAGRPAFDGAYALSVTAKVLLASPPPARRLRHEVPASFDALVGRMLTKQRDSRPPGGAAILALVRALQLGGLGGGSASGPASSEGGAEPWGYLGDALTAAASPPVAPKLVWLALALGGGAAEGAPGLPGRVVEVIDGFQATAQQLLDGSVLVRIEHERGGVTPAGHEVGALAERGAEDDPNHENRRHAMILGILRKARIQSQGGERAARCALAVRGAACNRPTALTLVPPSRPGEWLSAPAIDLAARLLDRGIRAGVQGVIMDSEGADLLDVERFSLLASPGGVIELRGEWGAQPV